MYLWSVCSVSLAWCAVERVGGGEGVGGVLVSGGGGGGWEVAGMVEGER